MKRRASITAKSLVLNIAVTVVQLFFITGITILVLGPFFRTLDESIAVNMMNRSLDAIEASSRSFGIMARGLASANPSEASHEAIMDTYGLEFFAISDENGRFSRERAWFGDEGEIWPVSDLREEAGDDLMERFARARGGDLWVFEAAAPDAMRKSLYIAVLGTSETGGERIVIGRRLQPFLALSVPMVGEDRVTLEPVLPTPGHPPVQTMPNLLAGRLFREIGPRDISLSLENNQITAGVTLEVPYFDRWILLKMKLPSYSHDSGRTAMMRLTLLHAFSFLTVICVSTLWIIIKVSRPLRRLVKGIRTWDGIRFPDFGPLKDRRDEVGEIARAFIHMSGEVRSKTKSLEDQVRRDGLTGLYNRRRFDETLTNEWDRHRRDGSPMTLVMADIDHFKAYNDIYGHPAGDECLRLVARAFGRGVRRPGDMPFRYGGEEFALILAATDLEGAMIVAESVRSAVLDLDLEHSGNSAEGRVTMSFGVAEASPAMGSTPEDLVRDADDALYAAKRSGRNRVN